jgi:fructose-bisphosphate aldolase class 1
LLPTANLAQHLSGVILFDESIRQGTGPGTPLAGRAVAAPLLETTPPVMVLRGLTWGMTAAG